MNKAPMLTAILLTTSLSGCFDSFRGAPKENLDREVLKLEETVIKQTLTPEKVERAIGRRDPGERNDIIFARMAELDLLYNDYEIDISNEFRQSGFAATVAELAVDTSGAVVGGATSQILSAISAGITGSKESFDKDILLDKTAGAFISQMRANRDTLKARILLKAAEATYNEYPLQAALTDLAAYRQAGTLTGALNAINRSAEAEEEEGRTKLEQAEETALPRAGLDQLDGGSQ